MHLCDSRYGRAYSETIMKFIVGVFVGAALMLGSAYLHDTGHLHVGPAKPFVNWSTVLGMLGR